MIEVKRPAFSSANITAYIPAVAGLTVTYSLQNLTTTSSNYLKFWNVGTVAWQNTAAANALTGVGFNPGLYTVQLNHATITGAGSDDLFAIVVYEATQPYHDFFQLRFGDAINTAILRLQNLNLPFSKQFNRVSDTQIETQTFSALVTLITTTNLNPLTGTATSGSTISVGPFPSTTSVLAFTVAGTYTGPLTPQLSMDNVNWTTAPGTPITDLAAQVQYPVIGSGVVGQFQVNITGYQYFRLTALGAVTGTATVTLANSLTLQLDNFQNTITGAGVEETQTVTLG
jgi:hypothetical protein